MDAIQTIEASRGGPEKTITDLIRSRHSTRSFSSQPVPRSALEQAFELAQVAPSSLNVQPWRVTVVSGTRLEKIKAGLHQAFQDQVPMTLPPNVELFTRHRDSFEDQLYFSANGFHIPRDDKYLYTQAFTQNFDFSHAPTAAIVALDKRLGSSDILSIGLYLQTLVLSLTDHGIQTCFQGTVAVWPDLVRKELGIGDDMQLLCSLAIGYEDKGARINHVKTQRDGWTGHVKFFD
jgi:nitroreductase